MSEYLLSILPINKKYNSDVLLDVPWYDFFTVIKKVISVSFYF